ncbi:MAG: DUF494 family protein [Gammaproteobacteria bacterium]|nr:DUF494 family protein [Gammaproteobacteria bacterium]
MKHPPNETIFDVLEYLFDRCLPADGADAADEAAVAVLTGELAAAGFSAHGIARAFAWLEQMWEMCDAVSADDKNKTAAGGEGAAAAARRAPIRQYSGAEAAAIGAEGQGLFLSLERAGIMDNRTREIVIDRLMALGEEDMALEDIKWVVLLVLGNHPHKREMVDRAEHMMLADAPAFLH